MQGSTVERMRSKRLKEYEEPITNRKNDKLTRRHRRLHRSIKHGEYLESNTLNKEE